MQKIPAGYHLDPAFYWRGPSRIRVGFRVNQRLLQELISKVEARLQSTGEEISSVMDALARETEYFMKDFAQWEDETGAARQSLSSSVFVGTSRISVYFYYDREVIFAINTRAAERGVDYSTFLETMQAGKYAILPWALEFFMSRLAHLLGRNISMEQRYLIRHYEPSSPDR